MRKIENLEIIVEEPMWIFFFLLFCHCFHTPTKVEAFKSISNILNSEFYYYLVKQTIQSRQYLISSEQFKEAIGNGWIFSGSSRELMISCLHMQRNHDNSNGKRSETSFSWLGEDEDTLLDAKIFACNPVRRDKSYQEDSNINDQSTYDMDIESYRTHTIDYNNIYYKATNANRNFLKKRNEQKQKNNAELIGNRMDKKNINTYASSSKSTERCSLNVCIRMYC